MLCKQMIQLGTQRSIIREIAAYGSRRKAEIGEENVLDFSIGNPNVPAPKEIAEAILDIVGSKSPVAYNSYTPSNGRADLRKAVADNLNRRYATDYTEDNFYITCGAAASLTISLSAIIADQDDEVIVFAPFFPEYKCFIESRGGKMVMVEPSDDFMIDPEVLSQAITAKTRAIILNSPNNPAGFVYTEANIKEVAEVLAAKSKEFGETIYIISDEPYRELVYGDVDVPFLPNFYADTLVCYSWSKSFSLPGERIGYILVPNKLKDKDSMLAAIAGAGRSLGFVCAPSLFQQVITRCIDVKPDLTTYENNRNLLLAALEKAGYEFAKPDGAFYMFIKSPLPGGGEAFAERLKQDEMLVVPARGFGCPDYVRLSYCTSEEAVAKAVPILERVMAEVKDQ